MIGQPKEGLFVGPPVPEPHVNKMIVASKSLAQFSKASCDSTNGNYSVVAFVACLSNGCSPANVGKLISFSVLNSFNRPAFFSISNIGVERFKVKPTLADLYPPASIISVVGVSRRKTPVFHCFPDCVNSCLGVPVDSVVSGGYFPAKATTGFCDSVFKAVICDYYDSFAVAKTKTLTTSAFGVFGVRQNDEPCESLADDVYSGRHSIASFNVAFSDGRWLEPAPVAIVA